MKKISFIILGFVTFILGTLGVFLPILPTTPFYLLTAFLWLNSSEKLHDFFVNSKYYDKYIKEMIIEKKMSKGDQRKMFVGIFFIILIPFILVDSLLVRSILVIVYVAHLYLLTRYFNKKQKVAIKKQVLD